MAKKTINWREKVIAFLLHFVLTMLLTAAAAALVFLVWYPDPFQKMTSGFKFFLLITSIDLALGPLISFIVYNSSKTRRALIFDYTIVGIVQVAAMAYGIYTIESSRPVYVAFVKDRYEIVAAKELAKDDLAAGKPPYRTLPKWGPELIGTQPPTDEKEHNEVVFAAITGKDLQLMPRYYVPYESVIDQVKRKAQTLDTLEGRHPESKPHLTEALADLGLDAANVRWLPVVSRGEFWTALIDAQTWRPIHYVPIDPY